MTDFPIVTFPFHEDEWEIQDIEEKGLAGVVVWLNDQKSVSLNFIDLFHFSETLEANLRNGNPCVSVKNLIVMKSLSKDKIVEAVRYLYNQRYFCDADTA